MSVIDKWLNRRRENDEPATSATTAANPNIPCAPNGLDVAGDLLQAATFRPEPENVAGCSSRVATENPITDQHLKSNVADVANVAADVNSRAQTDSTAGSATIDYRLLPKCCECGQPIAERLETWWGSERVHRACGGAAFQAAKARGAYLLKPNGKAGPKR